MAEAPKTPKNSAYVAQWTVSHNGEDVPEGGTLTLTDAEAQPLLSAGAVKTKSGKTNEVDNV